MCRVFPMLLLAGCWLSTAEIRDKAGLDDAPAEPPAPDDTDTEAPTDTEPPLDCVDDELGAVTGFGVAAGDSQGAGDDFAPDCYGGSIPTGADVALAWTAPSDGCWSFGALGANYDTILYVLDGCDGAELACNDDYNLTSAASEVGVALPEGETVVVVVDGWTDHVGDWSLDVQPGLELVADLDIGSRTGASAADGVTTGADTTMDPSACSWPSGSDVFVRWVAPSSDIWTFSLDPVGTTFDTVLSLHRQCAVDALACEDLFGFGGEEVSAVFYAGEEVFVRVAGYSDGLAPESGGWRLDITH